MHSFYFNAIYKKIQSFFIPSYLSLESESAFLEHITQWVKNHRKNPKKILKLFIFFQIDNQYLSLSEVSNIDDILSQNDELLEKRLTELLDAPASNPALYCCYAIWSHDWENPIFETLSVHDFEEIFHLLFNVSYPYSMKFFLQLPLACQKNLIAEFSSGLRAQFACHYQDLLEPGFMELVSHSAELSEIFDAFVLWSSPSSWTLPHLQALSAICPQKDLNVFFHYLSEKNLSVTFSFLFEKMRPTLNHHSTVLWLLNKLSTRGSLIDVVQSKSDFISHSALILKKDFYSLPTLALRDRYLIDFLEALSPRWSTDFVESLISFKPEHDCSPSVYLKFLHFLSQKEDCSESKSQKIFDKMSDFYSEVQKKSSFLPYQALEWGLLVAQYAPAIKQQSLWQSQIGQNLALVFGQTFDTSDDHFLAQAYLSLNQPSQKTLLSRWSHWVYRGDEICCSLAVVVSQWFFLERHFSLHQRQILAQKLILAHPDFLKDLPTTKKFLLKMATVTTEEEKKSYEFLQDYLSTLSPKKTLGVDKFSSSSLLTFSSSQKNSTPRSEPLLAHLEHFEMRQAIPHSLHHLFHSLGSIPHVAEKMLEHLLTTYSLEACLSFGQRHAHQLRDLSVDGLPCLDYYRQIVLGQKISSSFDLIPKNLQQLEIMALQSQSLDQLKKVLEYSSMTLTAALSKKIYHHLLKLLAESKSLKTSQVEKSKEILTRIFSQDLLESSLLDLLALAADCGCPLEVQSFWLWSFLTPANFFTVWKKDQVHQLRQNMMSRLQSRKEMSLRPIKDYLHYLLTHIYEKNDYEKFAQEQWSAEYLLIDWHSQQDYVSFIQELEIPVRSSVQQWLFHHPKLFFHKSDETNHLSLIFMHFGIFYLKKERYQDFKDVFDDHRASCPEKADKMMKNLSYTAQLHLKNIGTELKKDQLSAQQSPPVSSLKKSHRL